MPHKKEIDNIKNSLEDSCCEFRKECCEQIERNALEQHPDIAILCCSDSRVSPELIFRKNVGDIFDVRVAGNIAVDTSVLFSLEYAVEHLGVEVLLVLGHSGCGAVKAAENPVGDDPVLEEIRSSFPLHEDHCISNILRQMKLLPERSEVIRRAVDDNRLAVLGGFYHIGDGSVEFIEL